MKNARIGAVLFALWGLLHIAGGSMILVSLRGGAAAGYAIYGVSGVEFPAIAGSVLGYLAYGFVWLSLVVLVVALRYNWHNSEKGLMLNTALTAFTEIGLILFLILPGHVSWVEAIPGLLLFAGATVFCGIGCQSSQAAQSAAA